MVVAGDDAVEHRVVVLAAGVGVVIDHVGHDAQAQRVDVQHHLAVLTDASRAVGVGAVAAFGHVVVQGVVAPVEGVQVAHLGDDGLLSVRFGRQSGQGGRVGFGALVRVLVDRGDVERGQQVQMGDARLGQGRQVGRPVARAEGGIRAAQLGGHAGVGGAEVAHVQLVDDDVFGGGQRRPLARVPALRLQVGVIEVDDLAAATVGRKTDRVRVGDQIRLHRAGAGSEDAHLVEVVPAIPLRLADQRPDAGVGIDPHDLRFRALGIRVGVVEQHQPHALGRGRPDAQHGHAVLIADAQRAVVDVEVVDDAGQLQSGGVNQFAGDIGRGHGHLPLQGHAAVAGADGQMEHGVAGQMRVARGQFFGQSGGVVLHRDRPAVDAVAVEHQRLAGVVEMETVAVVRAVFDVPDNRVLGQPVGAGLGQTADRPAAANLDGHDFVVRVPHERY